MPGSSAFHPMHRLWRLFPPTRRRLWLARVSAALAPRASRSVAASCEGVIIAGETSRASGLGEAARIMQRGVEALGVRNWSMLAGLPVPGEAASFANGTEHAVAPARTAALLLHVNAPVLPAALLRLPRSMLRGRRIVGCWVWELQSMPESWRPACRCIHEVWTPSRFAAAALESLMPGRVRVVTYPLALAPPKPARLDRAAFGLPPDVLVVLASFSLASTFERKNPLAAIAAFRQAFGSRSDCILVLKVGHTARFTQDMQRLRDAVADAGNIRLETRTLPAADSHALTLSADIVLSLHRSEGFGLVPAEAMMLGRPVVATDWSATAEFLDGSCGAPVDYRLVPARDPRGIFEAPGAVWAEADIGMAARALLVLASAPERRAALGAAALQRAQSYFGGESLRAALDAIGAIGGAN